MTRLARQVRGNMVARLAERSHAVVAGGTAGGNSGVIHLRRDGETHRARVTRFRTARL